jgi:pyruvate dehydrogenase E2 component (dihydrolipoamide acetyltransferase)
MASVTSERSTVAMQTRVRALTVDGLRARVLELAPDQETDDPVLMIHGLGGWAENWRSVMPAVAASGRRAIAVDLPGFGESERPKRARYFDVTEPFYARFLVALLDELGIGHAHVAGHSFGGVVAFTLAVWRPDRVRSLALVAPGGVGRALPQGFRLLTLPGLELVARLRRSPAITRAVLYTCFHDPRRCPEEVVAESIRYGQASVDEMISVLRAVVSFRRGIRDEVRGPWIERLGRYRGPVLFVWGREDRVLPSSLLAQARELAPEAELRLIGSCGHLVMVERPDEFVEAFIPFLDRAA